MFIEVPDTYMCTPLWAVFPCVYLSSLLHALPGRLRQLLLIKSCLSLPFLFPDFLTPPPPPSLTGAEGQKEGSLLEYESSSYAHPRPVEGKRNEGEKNEKSVSVH